uniref:Uncharacterized protein n=1 Tax=Setaria viridis TaxID=4556 RepID=A0A4U6V4I0_SETVI|nr:hypothetical protein SEVIR_4G253100v2 [Setaria viridis]
MDILKSSSELNGNHLESPGKQQRERTAASVLFDWEMPLREACRVAVQRNHPRKQKLWKHTQARQLENSGLEPVIQIVCST